MNGRETACRRWPASRRQSASVARAATAVLVRASRAADRRHQFIENRLRTSGWTPASAGRNCLVCGSRQRLVFVQALPDPGFIERGVLAVARMQRHGVRRHAGDQHLVDRLFQHVQAGDSQNAIDVAADDDLQHDRRTFGDEHLVAELFGPHLVVGDRTGAAFFAIQPEFVVLGRAAFGVLEAMRQQQHPSLERRREELPLPEEVADQHHHEAEIFLRLIQFGQQLRPYASNSFLLNGLRLVESST